jgi:hypothetical protein
LLLLVGYNFFQSQTNHFEGGEGMGGLSWQIEARLDVTKTILVVNLVFDINHSNGKTKAQENNIFPQQIGVG